MSDKCERLFNHANLCFNLALQTKDRERFKRLHKMHRKYLHLFRQQVARERLH